MYTVIDHIRAELEPARLTRDAPPAHYTLKIESLSLISNLLFETGVEHYESSDFEIGGYKWRLSLYPEGDKERNGSGHISLYLVLAKSNTLPLGLEVNALFKLFVYDQIRDKYLTIQDVNMRRFHGMKTEWGFSQLLPLGTFSDAANGYLINDCCIFGAEVFVTNCTGKEGILSIIKEPQDEILTWKIDNFSKVTGNTICSKAFHVGGHKWLLNLYPNGASGEGRSLSIFLHSGCSLSSGQTLYVKYKLRVKNQADAYELAGHFRFTSSNDGWGFTDFMPLSDLKNNLKGFIMKDTLIVEAQITLLSAVKYLS